MKRGKTLAMTPWTRRWVLAKIKELALWTVFVVLAGLFPIWVVYNHERTMNLGPVSFKALFIKGELLLVAFGIAADSISRVISKVFRTGKRVNRGNLQLIGLVASITFLVMASNEYSTIISVGDTLKNTDYVANQSLLLFVAALFTGGGLILLH